MTENEFDKFFKDRVGDEEQSFEFRQDDWLAAAHEMDKVLPIATAAATTTMGWLAWHKWAAAAAVIFLASQVWLIAKIVDLKDEVVSLKQENATLAIPKNTTVLEKRIETIVLYDTVFKSVIIERPFYKDVPMNNPSLPAHLAETKNTDKNKSLPTTKPYKPSAHDKNLTPLVNKEKTSTDNRLDKNQPDGKTPLDNSNIAEKNTNQTDLVDTLSRESGIAPVLLVKDAMATLSPVDFQPVKSNRVRSSYIDLNEFNLSKKSIIQPAPLYLNGWSIGVNSHFVKTQYKFLKTAVNSGANVRLTYDLRSNWRLAADVDFWTEMRSQPDTSRQPHIKPPSPDYRLSKVNLTSKNVEIRLGTDYEWVNKGPITPFAGFGLTYKLQTENKIEYEFKRPGKPNYPIAIRNEDSRLNEPIFLNLRAGLMGKIYRRLGWSVNVSKDLPFSGKTNQILSGQVGLYYDL